MAGEFLSVVRGYRVQDAEFLQWPESGDDRIRKLLRVLAAELPYPQGHPRTVVDREQGPLPVPADHRIDFEVPEAFLPVDFRRAQLYAFPVADLPPALVPAAPGTLLLALVAQVPVQVVPVELPLPDILVYALRARRGPSQPSEAAASLLGAEILAQHGADLVPDLLAVLAMPVAFAPPRLRQQLGCFASVLALDGVSPDFPVDRTAVNPEAFRYLGFALVGLQGLENKVSLAFV